MQITFLKVIKLMMILFFQLKLNKLRCNLHWYKKYIFPTIMNVFGIKLRYIFSQQGPKLLAYLYISQQKRKLVR